ncbi:hypothetical protein C0416_01630 [bacterium]|nr:hypothetical protein [bacterium]
MAALLMMIININATFALGASPLKMEYASLPGQTINGQLTVYNTSDVTQKIIITKSDFDMDENQENMLFLNDEDESYAYSLQQWIILPQEDIIVGPKEKSVIPYQIAIPVEARAQGYYGALFVRSEPAPTSKENEQENSGVKIVTQIAHLVLLEVEGSIKDVSLKDFNIDLSAIDGSNTKTPFFDVVVYNQGNVHSAPEGVVEIINSEGETVDELQINIAHNNVLPQKTKTYFSEGYVKDLPAGTYYAVLDGKAENGQQLQGKITFTIDRQGKVEMIDKYIGAIDISSLKGTAQNKYVIFQTALAILAIFIFTIAFVAIGRYCIVSSKTFSKKSFYKFFRKK